MSEVETFINIGGQIVLASNVTLPGDKRFRDAWFLDGDVVRVDKSIALNLQRDAASLNRFDFASRAAAAGYVSYPEAAAWATGNAIPAALQVVIDGLPEDQRGPVLLDVLAMPTIRRNGSLMPAVIAAFDADEAAMDALFGIGV